MANMAIANGGDVVSATAPISNAPTGPAPMASEMTPRARPRISSLDAITTMVDCIVPNPAVPSPSRKSISMESANTWGSGEQQNHDQADDGAAEIHPAVMPESARGGDGHGADYRAHPVSSHKDAHQTGAYLEDILGYHRHHLHIGEEQQVHKDGYDYRGEYNAVGTDVAETFRQVSDHATRRRRSAARGAA